jgi:hypothetical protein
MTEPKTLTVPEAGARLLRSRPQRLVRGRASRRHSDNQDRSIAQLPRVREGDGDH